MLGTYNNDQPTIKIKISGVSGVEKEIEALVDSGFNGYLMLPFVEALPLGLVLSGIQASNLANGTTSSNMVCIGQICVDGKCIRTSIDINPNCPILLGTRLLKELGKTFILDCMNGIVKIVDSESPSGVQGR